MSTEVAKRCLKCNSKHVNWDILECKIDPVFRDGIKVGFSLEGDAEKSSYIIYQCKSCGYNWREAKKEHGDVY